MDLTKFCHDLEEKKFTDVEITLHDRQNEKTFHCHRVVLAFNCDYFYKLFTFGTATGHDNKYRIEVSDVRIAFDVIMSFYGIDSKENDIPVWLYVLKMVQMRDYFCLLNDPKMLYNLDVPAEGFELLLNIVEKFDVENDKYLLNLVTRSIPSGYPIDTFAIDFIKKSVDALPYFVVSYCSGGIIRIWDANTGEKHGTIVTRYDNLLHQMIMSPDKKYIVNGNEKHKIRFWDSKTYKLVKTIEHNGCHNGDGFNGDGFNGDIHSNVCTIAYMPDGKSIIAGYNSGNICHFDLETDRLINYVASKYKFTSKIKISPDGKLFASAAWYNKKLIIWDTANFTKIHEFNVDSDSVNDIIFSMDNEYIAVAGTYAYPKIWHVNSGNLYHSFGEHSGWIISIAFSNNGKLFASGCSEGEIKIWDLSTKTLFHNICNPGNVSSLNFFPDDEHIVSGGKSGKIDIWDVSTGKNIICINKMHEHNIENFAFIGNRYNQMEQKLINCLNRKIDNPMSK